MEVSCMSKKEKKQNKTNDWGTDVQLDIPEDEIWTYQVPGLAAPHVNKPYKYYNLKVEEKKKVSKNKKQDAEETKEEIVEIAKL